MLRPQFIHGYLPIGACAMAAFLGATPAWSAVRRACVAPYGAYQSAEAQEQAGHLRQARELYQSCAQQDAAVVSACAGLVNKCKVKVQQLTSTMPTVVPVATDESGTPRADVQVKIDGALLTSQLDGRGLPVEPGLHEFAFATDKGVFATEKVMIIEGQRNRPITASMGGKIPAASSVASPFVEARFALDPTSAAPAKAPDPSTPGASSRPAAAAGERSEPALPDAPAPPHPRGRSALPYVLGGVGVLGLGAGALLTYWGKKDNDEMTAQCGQTRTCPPGNVDHIRNLYLASDISLGVGLVAVGTAVVLFATSRSGDERPSTAHPRLDVQPTRSGAVASVSGAF